MAKLVSRLFRGQSSNQPPTLDKIAANLANRYGGHAIHSTDLPNMTRAFFHATIATVDAMYDEDARVVVDTVRPEGLRYEDENIPLSLGLTTTIKNPEERALVDEVAGERAARTLRLTSDVVNNGWDGFVLTDITDKRRDFFLVLKGSELDMDNNPIRPLSKADALGDMERVYKEMTAAQRAMAPKAAPGATLIVDKPGKP